MSISKHKTLSQAKDSFSKSDYKNALEKFAIVLQSFPNSKEAYNGVILSEMAMSGEGGAEALFDYYEILKEEDKEEADIIMGDILQNMDGSLEKLSEVFAEPLRDRLEFEDGILYKDFKAIIDEGDEVILLEPYYPQHINKIELAGAKVVTAPLDRENNFQIDRAAIESKITDRTKMICIVNPANPTGRVYRRDELEIIADHL